MSFIFRVLVICNLLLLSNNLLFSQEKKDSVIVEKVKEFTEKDNFFSKLIRNLFVFERNSFNGVDENNYRSFDAYKGKIIRKINVHVLDVFGPSLRDPDAAASSWIQKTGNAIHIQTRDWLIKDNLLFLQGEPLRPIDLSESERLLRQSNYIYDAQITVKRVNRDSVDVDVEVQDIWSITGNTSFTPSNKSGYVTLRDLNFLGFGTEVSSTVRYGDIYRNGWNWDGSVTINNIDRTFFTGQIYHFSQGNDRNFGISINRDFFSSVVQWAGGVGINWLDAHPVFITDSGLFIRSLYYNQQDLWGGYSFTFEPLTFGHLEYNNINLAVRSLSTLYTKKPEFDSLRIFQNNILYLARLGLSFRTYEKDRYIFQLGRTEDIPVGYLFELIFGVENGEFRQRPYYGIRAGLSTYGKSGFIYGGLQSGAYREKTGWINGIYTMDVLYFTKLLPLGNLRMRHYLWNRFAYRYDPMTQGQLLSINENNGVRGFTVDLLGNKKLTLNYENNVFIPINLLGFQFAVVSFADFGLLASKHQDLFNSRLYQGYGIGIRIRNEHLVFPAIQLMFGIYPGERIYGTPDYRFFDQSASFYQFNTFQFTKPSVIEF